MKKMSFFILCVMFATALMSAVHIHADNETNIEYLRCFAVGDAAEEHFDGFELPGDTEKLPVSDDKPITEGAEDGEMFKLDGDTYFRAVLPAAANDMSISYSLGLDDNTQSEEKGDGKSESKNGIATDGAYVLGVYITGDDSLTDADARVSVTFTDSEGKMKSFGATVRIGKPYVIYADMSDTDGVLFESAKFSATHGESTENSLTVITTLPCTSASADTEFLEKNSLLSLVCHYGEISLEGEKLTLATDQSDVFLDILPKKGGSEGSAVVYAAFGCAEGEGTVSAVADDSDHTDSSHSIFPESGLTLVRTVREKSEPLSFLFRSGSSVKLVIDSFGFIPTEEAPSANGSFTALSFKDGVISATGKLSMETVSRYPNATLGLFTLPVNTAGEPILLDEIKMTSRFTFSASLDKYPHAHTDNAFYVAVINGDEVIPATKSRFVSAKSGAVPAESILALHGANPISVFEAGVKSVLVDVDFSKLITNASASSTTVSRGGYIYGIDSEYLQKLDSNISFYRSIGVSVHVRLICTSTMHSSIDGTWLTYQGTADGEYMLRADARESLNMYPATVTFLSQRYSNIASFAISSGVNSKALTGIDYQNLWDSVCDVATIARLVYTSASEYLPDVTVTVPLALSGDKVYAPAETFAVLLGERLSSVGEIPWCVMYTAKGDAPSVLCENMKSSARANGVSSPLYFTVLYNAKDTDGDSTAAYEDYCNACGTSSVKTVFLSVENLTQDLSRESYSELKNYGGKDSLLYDADADTESVLEGITGSASLWDFTNTYSPEGWIPGYGMSSLQSARSYADKSQRALRCITDSAYSAGIFLCSFEKPASLAEAPLAEFIFDLEAAEGTKIVFVFGGSSGRAEFSLTDSVIYTGDDGKLHAVCDLSSYAPQASIGYIAVIIYSPERAAFELSRVDIHSKTADSARLSEIIEGTSDAESKPDIAPEYIVAGSVGILVLIVLSVRIVSLLSRYDKKNKANHKFSKKQNL